MASLLVVDDNWPLAEDLAEILECDGHRATVASDPEAALDMARQRAFDAALLDMRMPQMSGPELGVRLRALFPDLVLIFMTAYSDDTLGCAAQALHPRAVLGKPVDIERLRRLAEQAPGGPPAHAAGVAPAASP